LARRTLDEEITQLESERDSLETIISEQQGYKSLQGQGTEGATTDFVDPQRLYNRLDQIKARLSVLYRWKDSQ
jgi:hypothetical protein